MTTPRARKRRNETPAEVEIQEQAVAGGEEPLRTDLGELMSTSINQRFRASQALSRLRMLQQTVVTAASAGKSEIERKMGAALDEYRAARMGAIQARRRLLASLTSNESY